MEITETNQSMLLNVIKSRNPDSRKGDNGKVLVIGGSIQFAGSPALSAMSALRTGVDIVTVAAPMEVGQSINSRYPDLLTKKYKGDYLYPKFAKEVAKLGEEYDSILIGPGISSDRTAQKFVSNFLYYNKKPLIVDSDAVRVLTYRKIKNSLIILNPKELEYMYPDLTLTLDFNANIDLLKNISQENIILLKGQTDIITFKDKAIINKTGNEGMTVTGTGDILAGLCAGFYAKSQDLLNSACAGALLNGLIGDKLRLEQGYSFIASDFLNEIGPLINKISEKR